MTPQTSKAVQINQHGGPEELQIVDVTVGEPGPGEIRIRHKAVGLNYIDIYQRAGLYALPMPLRLGMEAAGVVEVVGDGVTHLQVGNRAAYASQPPGSYCEVRVMRWPKQAAPMASIMTGALDATSVTLRGVDVLSARYCSAL